MTLAGVGAVVDLPGMSIVVRGLEAWGSRGQTISEPRLLAEVRRALPDAGVTSLRAPPHDPDEADDAYASTGVPVTTFPRWLRCPACHRLLPIDGVNQLELSHRWGRRPDLAKWTHVHCPKQTQTAVAKRRGCIPARFLVACPRGHLDEFPYVAFVHEGRGTPCPGAELTMTDAGSLLGPRVTVTCTCGAKRNISQASGTKGAHNLPRCRGRHPHLQSFEHCDESLKLMVLGASNLWFNVSLSALHLPEDDPALAAVSEHWELLSQLVNPVLLEQVVAGMPALHLLQTLTADERLGLIDSERRRRARDDGHSEEASDLRRSEWELLSVPTTDKADDDFRAEPTLPPEHYEALLANVVKVQRLREVQAAIGFTRIDPPVRDDVRVGIRAPLSAGHVSWVPAVELRGEGIFVQLAESVVAPWEDEVRGHRVMRALSDSYARWRANRDLAPDSVFPVARYVLVHTFSHLLLRQVALECGYSQASIRERLYVGTPDHPTAGVLLSTAASDSEGTLGGLVALADAKFLGRLLTGAFDGALTCSSDPLCSDHVPVTPSDRLHAAACHACLFVSETSCEAGNRWLHRGVIADMADSLAIKW